MKLLENLGLKVFVLNMKLPQKLTERVGRSVEGSRKQRKCSSPVRVWA